MKKNSTLFRCPILGSIDINASELKIVDHPLFQRLRSTSQLGLANLVFPGACHNRFIHSLGTLYFADRLFCSLIFGNKFLADNKSNSKINEIHRWFRLAALLHDIGHQPFSHSSENYIRINFIADSSTKDSRGELMDKHLNTHEAIGLKYIKELPESILPIPDKQSIQAILTGKVTNDDGRFKIGEFNLLPILNNILSGEIDCDRMDYLLRDSYFCGVPYGKFDSDYLIKSLGIVRTNDSNLSLAIVRQGLFSFYSFAQSRISMNFQVYNHKTLLGFDYYLEKAFEDGEIPKDLLNPWKMEMAGENMITSSIYTNRHKKWSGFLANRLPAKVITRLTNPSERQENKIKELVAELAEKKIEPIIHQRKIKKSIQPGQLLILDKIDKDSRKYEYLHPGNSLMDYIFNDLEILQLSVNPADYRNQKSFIDKLISKYSVINNNEAQLSDI